MPGIEDSKCILVTGATAGIGRALALSLAKLSTKPQVIASGRRQDRLDELKTAGLETIRLDLDTDASSLKKVVDSILQQYPELDTVILNAGMQHESNFKKVVDVEKFQSELNVNYTSVVTVIAYLMPHFLKLSDAGRPSYIVVVTAGLGIVPAPWIPGYSASKAALHSFVSSLRMQMKGTNIHVLEIIPPLVESELHDAEGTTQSLMKMWMPLDKYTEMTMEGLRNGDPVISAGGSLEWYEKYSKDKQEMIQKLQESRDHW